MNDIDKMPSKCHGCPYWEVCEYPYICDDIKPKQHENGNLNAEFAENPQDRLTDELIRKQDALDALMAERKHLLAKGQNGAEHVLTHHGYNVIAELPPVQSDVPVINVGDMISRQAAIDALCRGEGCGNICSRAIRALPPVQPKRGKWKDGKCDQCSGSAPFWPLANTYYCSNFCPHCGADMRGGKDG